MLRFLSCLILVIWLSGPVKAQGNDPAPYCNGMGQFVGIVDLANILLRDSAHQIRPQFDTLAALVIAFDQDTLPTQLATAKQSHRLADIQLYFNDLERFVSHLNSRGPQFSAWVLNSATFRARHALMLELSQKLCEKPLGDQFRDTLAGLWPSQNSKPETQTSKIQQIILSPIGASKGLSSFSIRKESLMLLSVFAILAFVMCLLFGLSYVMKLARAIRLDRYACTVPATLQIGCSSITGHIDILGNRGLSFVVHDADNPAHAKELTLDRRVVFVIEATRINAVLTKEFDGSAGFRLSAPLDKPKIQKILDLSETQTYRKLEIGKKKKPARPKRAKLTLNSGKSPAE